MIFGFFPQHFKLIHGIAIKCAPMGWVTVYHWDDCTCSIAFVITQSGWNNIAILELETMLETITAIIVLNKLVTG